MKITVAGVELDEQRQLWYAALTIADDTGATTRMAYAFPTDTMEWRAAEYGIAPGDTATLLDLVLAEPHLTPEEWATGHQLHTAPDLDTARRDHIARCASAKLRCRMSTRTKDSPLDRVRTESVMHPEVIALKAEVVAQARAAQAIGRRKAARAARVESGEERAARLREQFFAPQPMAKDGES